MARASETDRVRMIDFAAARDEGLANLDEIAGQEGETGLSLADVKDYLTKNIAFQMDEEMKNGLELYFELASKLRLIENEKPLRFLGE